MSRVHKFLNGELKHVDTEFRCQACGHLFVDEERQFCEAPPVGKTLAAQKVRALHAAKQTGEYLTPSERIAAESVAKLIRGGTPIEEAKPTAVKLSEEELAKMRNELRRAHLHHLLAFNAKQRPDHPGPIEEYIENGIKQLEADWLKASQA